MATISLNIDTNKGMCFTSDDKLGVNLSTDSSSLIQKRSNGLYVPSLKGANGLNGGSSPDGHTIEDVDNKPQVNRDNVALIYSMVSKSSISEIVSECNKGNLATPYLMHTNDLFMFRSIKHAAPILNNGDDGNRYPTDTCTALFVITGVSINSQRNITSLKLKCLWSTVSGWVKGTTYSS